MKSLSTNQFKTTIFYMIVCTMVMTTCAISKPLSVTVHTTGGKMWIGSDIEPSYRKKTTSWEKKPWAGTVAGKNQFSVKTMDSVVKYVEDPDHPGEKVYVGDATFTGLHTTDFMDPHYTWTATGNGTPVKSWSYGAYNAADVQTIRHAVRLNPASAQRMSMITVIRGTITQETMGKSSAARANVQWHLPYEDWVNYETKDDLIPRLAWPLMSSPEWQRTGVNVNVTFLPVDNLLAFGYFGAEVGAAAVATWLPDWRVKLFAIVAGQLIAQNNPQPNTAQIGDSMADWNLAVERTLNGDAYISPTSLAVKNSSVNWGACDWQPWETIHFRTRHYEAKSYDKHGYVGRAKTRHEYVLSRPIIHNYQQRFQNRIP